MANRTETVPTDAIVVGDGIYITWDENRRAYQDPPTHTSMYVVRSIETPTVNHPDTHEFDIDTGVPITEKEHWVSVPNNYLIRRDLRRPVAPSDKN